MSADPHAYQAHKRIPSRIVTRMAEMVLICADMRAAAPVLCALWRIQRLEQLHTTHSRIGRSCAGWCAGVFLACVHLL